MDADVTLPLEKLSVPSIEEVGSSNTLNRKQPFVVLLLSGSFNPPTYMHLRIFELAKDALRAEGYFVIGGYMSPVSDAYKKKGLLSSTHRLQMCNLACKSSSFIMVYPWEVRSICRDFGIVCIRREGKDIEKIISSDEILYENKNNIISVDEIVPNQISSTRVRECIKKGLSVKYLLADEVIDYIRDNRLYLQSEDEEL